MRIETIEYENFRNFKDHGTIKCSTDGKMTIIYGKNGDGKTTLHQLFQWIIYGQVKFNKTTTDHLYNLAFENELPFGQVFNVMGRIDFEHEGNEYSLTRTYTYKKCVDDSEKIGEDLSLQKMDDDYNWKRVEQPEQTIEKMLPSGLAEYFFFDGESMIADLRVKGKDSAAKLRKALYSMFDLDVIESAINHIGRTDLKTTVLGKLYLGKSAIGSGGEVSAVKTNIETAQNRLSNQAKDKLSRLKGKTGIKNWNVLCRWAFCFSLHENTIPTDVPINADSNVEMSWYTFAGEFSEIYDSLMIEWCYDKGIEVTDENLAKYFKLHLERGISYLTGTNFIKNLDDLLNLAIEA